MKQAESLKEHFMSFWNYNDAMWLTFCPTIVLLSIPSKTPIDIEVLTTMSAFATFSMQVKVMDWMRIFSHTSFYVYLIQETIKRIAAFMMLMVISLMIFGIPMVMLNMNRTIDGEDEVIPEVSKFWMPNMVLNQYLLALGEFQVDEF